MIICELSSKYKFPNCACWLLMRYVYLTDLYVNSRKGLKNIEHWVKVDFPLVVWLSKKCYSMLFEIFIKPNSAIN